MGVLSRVKPPPSNLSPEEWLALRALQQDEGLVILPADKGRMTVLLDREEYDCKMIDILSDESTYKKLVVDPTPSLQRKMNKLLLDLKKEGQLPPGTYDHLRCSSGTIPSIYGLPKVHKPNVPLCPIVSFCSSPTYNHSKFLVAIISPLVGKSPSTV